MDAARPQPSPLSGLPTANPLGGLPELVGRLPLQQLQRRRQPAPPLSAPLGPAAELVDPEGSQRRARDWAQRLRIAFELARPSRGLHGPTGARSLPPRLPVLWGVSGRRSGPQRVWPAVSRTLAGAAAVAAAPASRPCAARLLLTTAGEGTGVLVQGLSGPRGRERRVGEPRRSCRGWRGPGATCLVRGVPGPGPQPHLLCQSSGCGQEARRLVACTRRAAPLRRSPRASLLPRRQPPCLCKAGRRLYRRLCARCLLECGRGCD
mmetsp:Transcript_10073/g.39231  ORF Transcript_10073/g.39231 Transcript_10073/m.39231 type:complete len:264 (-) Transcript_10073:110-901(-)